MPDQHQHVPRWQTAEHWLQPELKERQWQPRGPERWPSQWPLSVSAGHRAGLREPLQLSFVPWVWRTVTIHTTSV